MGKERGPYVDNYVVTNSESICTKLGRPVVAVSFYGYCNIRPLFDPIWPVQRAEASQRIVENMLQRSRFRRPQLVLAHIFLPAHAWQGFDMNDEYEMSRFAALYLASTEITARGYWLKLSIILKPTIRARFSLCLATMAHGLPSL